MDKKGKSIVKKFSHLLLNVTCEFLIEENNEKRDGYYDDASKDKRIIVNHYLIYKRYKKAGINYVLQEIENTVLHELTHLFDLNFYKSWQYPEYRWENTAIFTECFHSYIEEFKNQILNYYKEEILNDSEK